MLGGVFLQSYGFFAGDIGTFLNQLQQAGVFAYMLPFLIIFAIVFGVLSRMNMFGTNSKVPNAIIALSVSLMSLQFGFVSQFFSEIFPRMGVWLSVLLVLFIVVGLANPTRNWNKGIMISVGVIIFGVILYQSFGANWYNLSYWLPDSWLPILLAILAIVGIGTIIANTPESREIKVPEIAKNFFGSSAYS